MFARCRMRARRTAVPRATATTAAGAVTRGRAAATATTMARAAAITAAESAARTAGAAGETATLAVRDRHFRQQFLRDGRDRDLAADVVLDVGQ